MVVINKMLKVLDLYSDYLGNPDHQPTYIIYSCHKAPTGANPNCSLMGFFEEGLTGNYSNICVIRPS